MKNKQKGSALLVTVLIVVILASVGTLFFSQQLFRSEPETADVEVQKQTQASSSPVVQNNTDTIASSSDGITPVANKKTITYIPNFENATSIVIDFSLCEAGSQAVYFSFGHIVFKFNGIVAGKCHFQYGMEIENPRWDGSMSYTCAVPASLGMKTYSVKEMGVAMNELYPYCPAVFLLSPKDSEVLKMGQKYEIKWIAQGVENVSISLVSGGKDFGLVTEKSSVKASDGKFVWTVPDMTGWYESGVTKNNFRLYISSGGSTSVGDISDGTFTIQ